MKPNKIKIYIYLYMFITIALFILILKLLGVTLAMLFGILSISCILIYVYFKRNRVPKITSKPKVKFEEPKEYELDNIENLRDHINDFESKNYCYIKTNMEFLGENKKIKLTLGTNDEHKIDERVLVSIEFLLKCWNKNFQETIVKRIIQYYNEEEKYSYGPSDKEESKKWWPELNTVEEMNNNLIFNGILVNPYYLKDGNRSIVLLFSHYWGFDNTGDDNGVGILLTNEKIESIGYQGDFY